MKIDRINEFISYCSKLGLSPNEYCTLHFIYTGKEPLKTINTDGYSLVLRSKGYLDKDKKFTDKAHELFKEKSIPIENIETYKSLWPSIILPSGKNARCASTELKIRFQWFIDNFDYDWNTIYKATEEYIKYYADRGYNFMRTSAYFIFKEDTPKLRTSTLAEWCDKVTTGIVENESFDIDI